MDWSIVGLSIVALECATSSERMGRVLLGLFWLCDLGQGVQSSVLFFCRVGMESPGVLVYFEI